MPKKATEEKKKKGEPSKVSDLDIVAVFVKNKTRNLYSPHLKMSENRKGKAPQLWFRQHSQAEYYLLAEIGVIESPVSGKRRVLILDPTLITAEILHALYGGFPEKDILWRKGLVHLPKERAISLYQSAQSPLLQMDGSNG